MVSSNILLGLAYSNNTSVLTGVVYSWITFIVVLFL